MTKRRAKLSGSAASDVGSMAHEVSNRDDRRSSSTAAAATNDDAIARAKEINARRFQKQSEKRSALKVDRSPIDLILTKDDIKNDGLFDLDRDALDVILKKLDEEDDLRGSETSEELMQIPAAKRKRTSHSREFPSHLRRVGAKEPIRAEERCGCGRKMQVKQRKTREILSIVPAELVVATREFRQMNCNRCNESKWDRTPEVIMYQCQHSQEMMVETLAQRYIDGLPLNRQSMIWSLNGAKVYASTLFNFHDRAERYMRCIYFALLDYIKSSYCVQMDETPIQTIGEKKFCYAWGALVDERRWNPSAFPAVAFTFENNRSHIVPKHFFEGASTEVVLTDGYTAYNVLRKPDAMDRVRENPKCNTHARRRATSILKNTPNNDFCKLVVNHYGEVYRVENALYGKSPEARVQGRVKSRLVMQNLRAHMIRESNRVSKKSDVHSMISYFLNHYDDLTYFLKDGRVEADTNLIENQIRPIAMLRRACLFAGSLPGGQIWMLFASLIGTCRLNGVNPRSYLAWALRQLNDNWARWTINGEMPIERARDLLPWNCPTGRFNEELNVDLAYPGLAA